MLNAWLKFYGLESIPSYSEYCVINETAYAASLHHAFDSRVETQVSEMLRGNHEYNERFEYTSGDYDVKGFAAVNVLRLMRVTVASDDWRSIAFYPTMADASRRRRVKTKPARFVKRFGLSDFECEQFAKWWRETFSPRSYNLTFGKSREDFYKAASRFTWWRDEVVDNFAAGQSNTPRAMNNHHDHTIKLLHTSCMRGTPKKNSRGMRDSCWTGTDYETDIQPMETYASGEFTCWTLLLDDKVAARSVVLDFNKSAAPIYAADDFAAQYMVDAFNAESIKPNGGYAWDGAKLLLIRDARTKQIAAPYMDMNSNGGTARHASISDCGEFLVLDRYHGACLDRYACIGVVQDDDCEDERFVCSDCGNLFDESDAHTVNDQIVCEECYCNNYSCCEHCDDMESSEDMTEVFYLNSRGATRSQQWCAHCTRVNATECHGSGEVWRDDDIIVAGDGESYSQNYLMENMTFGELSGEYWPSDECVQYLDSYGNEEYESREYLEGTNEYFLPQDSDVYVSNETHCFCGVEFAGCARELTIPHKSLAQF